MTLPPYATCGVERRVTAARFVYRSPSWRLLPQFRPARLTATGRPRRRVSRWQLRWRLVQQLLPLLVAAAGWPQGH